MEPQTKEEAPDVDSKGVPLLNRFMELDRKFQERDKELAAVKSELAALKAQEESVEPAAMPEPNKQARLMEFVADPDAWYAKKRAEEDQERNMKVFQSQMSEAEQWIKSQPGYTGEDDAKVYQIIKDNKLDTPYHFPMERAKTAWKILSAEKREKAYESMTDEQKREQSVKRTSGETGKSVPKSGEPTRADIIAKLQKAEMSGDIETSIKYMGMLEDVR